MTTASAEIFDAQAAAYDLWFESADGRVLFESELAALRLIWPEHVGPGLEIGVGTGRFAQALGVELGIEPAAGMADIAMQRGLQVTEGVGERLPYPDGTFARVLVVATLCFVADPRAVLREACRVLREGGRLVIGEVAADSPWGRLYERKKEEGHPFYRHAHFHSVSAWREMLAAAGLTFCRCASTLQQAPGCLPSCEAPTEGWVEEAGFVALLAEKRCFSEAAEAQGNTHG